MLSTLGAVNAVAQPAAGPRETVDEGFTTTSPNAPTGLTFSGTYHASGDPRGDPPYLRRMVTTFPPGMRLDTSVPDRCTATDAQLAVLGPDACPPGSRLGGGKLEGLIYEPVLHGFVFDHYQHPLELVNNAGELILMVHSEGYTIVRGTVRADSSVEFSPPSCFPAPPTGCADDYVLMLRAATVEPPYVTTSGGAVRSYATTPPSCPSTGSWSTTVQYWWSDGSTDRVTSNQPCQAPRTPAHRRARSRGAHRCAKRSARHGSARRCRAARAHRRAH